jgi:hypothetical protein
VITEPRAARILEVVRQEIADGILPAVDDPQLVASLQMIQQILGTLAVRADHEIAYLVEEIAAAERLGAEIQAVLPEAVGVIAALHELRAIPSVSLHVPDLLPRYSAASELLSRAFDEVPANSPLRSRVEETLDLRLAHEVEVIGDFSLINRSG